MRRVVFTPDNTHSLSICELRDGCLLVLNQAKIPFNFTISRNHKVVATVNCVGSDAVLKINTNWRLSLDGIQNREIHTNPDLVMSPNLNIEIGGLGLGRIDLKVDDTGFAACAFSNKELLMVKMNGNHTFPRLEGFIDNEVKRTLVDSEIRRIKNDPDDEVFKSIVNDRLARIENDPQHEVFRRIGKKYFESCLN